MANNLATDFYAEFRDSVTSDLYDPSRYIEWGSIEDRLNRYKGAIGYLQSLLDSDTFNEQTLSSGLEAEPYLYEVLTSLLAIPRGVGFHDGRELPDPARRPESDFTTLANLLIEVGLPKLFEPGLSIQSLVRVALTGLDALKRRYRVDIKERVEQIVADAIAQANHQNDLGLTQVPKQLWPQAANERVEYIFALNDRPSIAIASVFQAASGGRQQKDLSVNFPNLQRELSENGIRIILIADGRGLKAAQETVLKALFDGVSSCMTLSQASAGFLLEEIIRLASSLPTPSRSLNRIILSTLNSRGRVEASDLPIDFDKGRLALAAFFEAHTDLDLALADEGGSLYWSKLDLVNIAKGLTDSFSASEAVQFFSSLIDSSINASSNNVESLCYSIQSPRNGNGILPQKFLVAASPKAADAGLLREVASLALMNTPESKVSILLLPNALPSANANSLRSLQSSLTSNVVVIDSNLLLEMTQRSEMPSVTIAQKLLEQSDLIKASPFVVNGVTPERMFFGREAEEATMISKLASNSVALLGGRRIGKTSLMRHVEKRLGDAGFVTYFGDCQTVREWADFAAMAQREWGVSVPTTFKPSKLFDLVGLLIPVENGRVVFLLDEIDQLLDWDTRHSEDKVTEGFFRACRTLSQEHIAQFVFSGERIIANRLWDAHSPHWNFCHSLMLRQLDPHASARLLLTPLKALQILIEDEGEFVAFAWSRTNGHPQLLQFLGDRLIRNLNEREPRERSQVSPAALADVADNYAFAEQYLETYWGQATTFERLMSLIVATGKESLGEQKEFLTKSGVEFTDDQVRSALRMLELYGVARPTTSGYTISLDWFLEATEYYGGVNDLVALYSKGRL